jgi:hypothetical protein
VHDIVTQGATRALSAAACRRFRVRRRVRSRRRVREKNTRAGAGTEFAFQGMPRCLSCQRNCRLEEKKRAPSVARRARPEET